MKRLIVPAIVLAAGLYGGFAHSTDRPAERELNDVQVYSFDPGGHVPRLWMWCTSTGGNGVYQNGDTDQFQVIESDPECAEGGRFS